MAEHTSPGEGIAPKRSLMGKPMASHAQCHAVPNVKSQIRVLGKGADMVSIQVAACVVSAVAAGKSIAVEYVISPTLQIWRKSLAPAFQAFSIDIARSIFTAGRAFASYSANFGARFQRMFFTDPIARSRLSRRAHLGATFGRHFFSLFHSSIVQDCHRG